MDRGIPTEKVLEQMRRAQPPVQYLVGTPRGRLSQYEQRLAGLPWQVAREGVKVKLLSEDQELYVLAESHDRVNKERAVRRRQLKGLWQRLKKLQGMKLKRDALLNKLKRGQETCPLCEAWGVTIVSRFGQPCSRRLIPANPISPVPRSIAVTPPSGTVVRFWPIMLSLPHSIVNLNRAPETSAPRKPTSTLME